MTTEGALPPVDRLVPHAPPMRLVDKLVAYDGRGATCEAELRAGHPFEGPPGRVPALVGVELLAQTAAVLMGYRGFLRGGAVQAGMLVGVPKCETRVAHFDVGDVLRCSVQERFTVGRSTQLDGRITRAGETVCEATLNVIVGTDADEEPDEEAAP